MATAIATGAFRTLARTRPVATVEKSALKTPPTPKESVKRLSGLTVPRKRPGSSGSISLEVLVPSEVEGVVVFVHGFAQYPDAYMELLYGVADKAKVAILAPETGIFSGYVWKQLLSNFLDYVKEYGGSGSLQYALQSTLAQDSKEVVEYVREDNKVISDTINDLMAGGKSCSPDKLPMGLFGHSMGGGLLFWVAANSNIETFCSLSPFPKLQGEYDPSAIIDSADQTNWSENALLVAGSLDFVAREGLFSKPGADIFNLVKETASNNKANSIYAEIYLGLHSNFEDGVFVGETPLKKIVRVISVLFSIFAIPLRFLTFGVNQFLLLLQIIEGRSEQIEISIALASYWLDQGMSGKKPTIDGLRNALKDDPNVSEKRDKSTKIEGPDGSQ